MPVIFKFMESRWAEKFVIGQCVLISPLSSYRNTELHGLNKGDKTEGLNVIRSDKALTIGGGQNMHLLKQIDFHPSSSITISGSFSMGQIGVTCEDHYVFCATTKFSTQIARDLDPKYDCCVRIADSAALAGRLTKALRKKGADIQNPRARPVTYRPRIMRPENVVVDADPFTKDTMFYKQQEYRIAWKPTTPNHASDFHPKLSSLAVEFDPTPCGMSIYWRR